VTSGERQLVGQGTRKLLGELVCFSCQEHNRCSYEDKYLDLNNAYYVSKFADGSFESFSYGIKNAEKEEDILVGLNTVSNKLLEKFYSGVSYTFQGRKLECASCSSQEFLEQSS